MILFLKKLLNLFLSTSKVKKFTRGYTFDKGYTFGAHCMSVSNSAGPPCYVLIDLV